jgi:hypothetical protein
LFIYYWLWYCNGCLFIIDCGIVTVVYLLLLLIVVL